MKLHFAEIKIQKHRANNGKGVFRHHKIEHIPYSEDRGGV